LASVNPGILVFEMVMLRGYRNILVEGGMDERKITADFLDGFVDLNAGDSRGHEYTSL